MKNLTFALSRFAGDESGVTTLEYALLTSLIAIVCITVLVGLGENADGLYTRVCNKVSEAISGAPAC